MKYRHYAPKTKCILVEKDDDQIDGINKLIKENNNCCVLGYLEDKEFINIDTNSDRFICLGSRDNLEEVSKNLFTSIRKIDTLNCDYAIIEGVEKKNLGLSIMNRISRACEN